MSFFSIVDHIFPFGAPYGPHDDHIFPFGAPYGPLDDHIFPFDAPYAHRCDHLLYGPRDDHIFPFVAPDFVPYGHIFHFGDPGDPDDPEYVGERFSQPSPWHIHGWIDQEEIVSRVEEAQDDRSVSLVSGPPV